VQGKEMQICPRALDDRPLYGQNVRVYARVIYAARHQVPSTKDF